VPGAGHRDVGEPGFGRIDRTGKRLAGRVHFLVGVFGLEGTVRVQIAKAMVPSTSFTQNCLLKLFQPRTYRW
jgi:hypothetical protein